MNPTSSNGAANGHIHYWPPARPASHYAHAINTVASERSERLVIALPRHAADLGEAHHTRTRGAMTVGMGGLRAPGVAGSLSGPSAVGPEPPAGHGVPILSPARCSCARRACRQCRTQGGRGPTAVLRDGVSRGGSNGWRCSVNEPNKKGGSGPEATSSRLQAEGY